MKQQACLRVNIGKGPFAFQGMEACKLEKCVRANEAAILSHKFANGRRQIPTEHLDMVEIFTPNTGEVMKAEEEKRG